MFFAGSNTFGSGSGTTTPFTVYSAATFGTSGTTSTLTIYSPTTQEGSLTATGTVYFTGSLTAAGELIAHGRALTGGQAMQPGCPADHQANLAAELQSVPLAMNISSPRVCCHGAGPTIIGTAGTIVGLTINSPTLHSSSVNIQDNTTIGTNSSNLLTVDAVANFTAPVLLQSSLTAASLTLSGGLTVQGSTVLGSSSSNTLVVMAAAAASSTLSVAGLLTASGGLAVSGTTALAGERGTCSQMLKSYVLNVL